jgi:hypothetical protein
MMVLQRCIRNSLMRFITLLVAHCRRQQHVYINHGLKLSDANPIAVFEVGLGTGLNAALTAQFAIENQCEVRYVGIEKVSAVIRF